jgi:oxaloacetate decarboxylase alpha subunit
VSVGRTYSLRSDAVPRLVDTTIRLLGQEPLAGRVPTSELLRLADILDRVGFAYLEVSGGGCFDAAVRRGVESPWERIRALKARTSTPLGLALRGRFLVGSRPVDDDFVRRFIASAAASGIDVFRLNDPLNDVANLRHAAEAIADAGGEFEGGIVYSRGPSGETDELVEQARKLPELGAARVLLHDPTGSLQPHRAHELIGRLRGATGLPVGIYCQGSGGNALAAALDAARAGADVIATAVYPLALALHRVSGEALAEALAGIGLDPGVNLEALWEASDAVDAHIGDEPVTPLAPRIAVRAARHDLPAGLVARIDANLRGNAARDRIDEVIAELERVRNEAGSPPLAEPIGEILASQALLHVLSASRYGTVADEFRVLVEGGYGEPPAPVDPGVLRAVSLVADPDSAENATATLDEARLSAEGLASSEEELLLVGLFGEEVELLLRAIRGRTRKDDTVAAGVELQRGERIREIVRIVQESGVAEVTIEDEEMRVTVRRTEETVPLVGGAVVTDTDGEPGDRVLTPSSLVRIEAPMVGNFYRAAQPGAPAFVEEGDPVAPGQTLCIIEAMKLMNEIKAELEGVVRAIHVKDSQPVEYGQLLFELELIDGRPLDAV